MRFMSVREFRLNTGKVRRDLDGNNEVVLTANGKPYAIVTKIRPESLDLELQAIRRARARVALDGIRASAAKAGTSELSGEQIDAVVRDVRRKKVRK